MKLWNNPILLGFLSGGVKGHRFQLSPSHSGKKQFFLFFFVKQNNNKTLINSSHFLVYPSKL